MHLQGYLGEGSMGELEVVDKGSRHAIAVEISNFGDVHGTVIETDRGLGEEQVTVNNCNLRILVTDKECSLEDAEGALLDRLYGGNLFADLSNVGYSEYTILSMEVDTLKLGGHDLTEELKSFIGKYIHFILEVTN